MLRHAMRKADGGNVAEPPGQLQGVDNASLLARLKELLASRPVHLAYGGMPTNTGQMGSPLLRGPIPPPPNPGGMPPMMGPGPGGPMGPQLQPGPQGGALGAIQPRMGMPMQPRPGMMPPQGGPPPMMNAQQGMPPGGMPPQMNPQMLAMLRARMGGGQPGGMPGGPGGMGMQRPMAHGGMIQPPGPSIHPGGFMPQPSPLASLIGHHMAAQHAGFPGPRKPRIPLPGQLRNINQTINNSKTRLGNIGLG